MTRPGAVLPYLTFIGLFILVAAQPVFELLGRQVEFFVFRSSGIAEIIVFAILVAYGIPTLLYCFSLLIKRLSKSAGKVIDVAWISIFSALLCSAFLRSTEGPEEALIAPIAALIGVLFAVGYLKRESIRTIVRYMAILALAAPAFFLWNAYTNLSTNGLPDSGPINTHSKSTPVFMLVFDELPLGGLLNDNGGIDEVRFPHFARLAATTTWYRNASTVADATSLAIPSILTGNRPTATAEGALVTATAANHPRNLFSLLASSRNIVASETITRLCPTTICTEQPAENLSLFTKTFTAIIDSAVVYAHIVTPQSLTKHLPPINSNWGGFKTDRFGINLQGLFFNGKKTRQLFRDIEKATPQDVHYIHLNMPHHPWIHYGSGKQYRKGYFDKNLHPDVIDWMHVDGHLWGVDKDALEVARQRQQLQIAYSDKLLGSFMEGIKKSGQFSEALIVVLADHGSNIEANEIFRWAAQENVEQLMSIPLFVKYPRQNEPSTNDLNAEIIDVMPTIAQVLQVDHQWAFEGHSLLDLKNKPSQKKQILRSILAKSNDKYSQQPRLLTVDDPGIFEYVSQNAAKHFRPHNAERHGDMYLHDRSHAPNLLGIDISNAQVSIGTRVAKISDRSGLSLVKLHRLELPGFFRVSISKIAQNEELLIAFALNGTIHSTRLISASNSGALEVVLPEGAFVNGKNQLEVFLVEKSLATLTATNSTSIDAADVKLTKFVLHDAEEP